MTGGRVERRLAAVLAADVAGYSQLMSVDELGTLEALKTLRREVLDPAIATHKGRIVKTTGDGLLVEFASAVDAATCAVAVQDKIAARNEDAVPKITLRIGINDGDIIVEGEGRFPSHLGRFDEARDILSRVQVRDSRYQRMPWIRPEDHALRIEGVRLAFGEMK